MQQTPLITQHRAAGAKLVDFAGWEMPIQYSGVVDEYHTVRSKAGLFDVSHMGRIVVTGTGAAALLQRVTTNDIEALPVSQAQYSFICNDQGGIKDDIFVYRLKPEEYLLCVNASNQSKIFSWLFELGQDSSSCKINNHSSEIAQLAIQGPSTRAIVAAIGLSKLEDLKLRHVTSVSVRGVHCVVARTGYTGEFGYEFYVFGEASTVWEAVMEAGRPFGLKPAGLGARDLLRLEMGYLLYGNDINEETTPIEAGAEWAVSFQKGEFIGRNALLVQRQAGVPRRFVGFELLEKAVPRHGFKILGSGSSQVIGEVTSGNLSPLLQKGIGLGYVPVTQAAPGTAIMIDVRGKAVPAHIVKTPFYRKPKAQGI